MKRTDEFEKFLSLAFEQVGWAGHFDKPCSVRRLEYSTENPSWLGVVILRLKIDQVGGDVFDLSPLDHTGKVLVA